MQNDLSSSSSSSFICLYIYKNIFKRKIKQIIIVIIHSKLLGEETSRNHKAYRRGHLDITILSKISAAKECGRN